MSRQSGLRTSIALSTILCGVAAAASAWAADAPATGTSGQENATLVITAERRVSNLETTPIAANVLSQETLDEKGVRTIDDLEYAVPSLTISSGGQSNYMNIRGIGKNDNAGNTTSAVATYRDGVGTVSGFFNGEPYYDIKSVEVLRGPQGTFVGQNAAGGAIFVNTNDPDPHAGFSGWGEIGVGNYSKLELSGAINIPFSDTFAARIAFDHVQRDSFYHVFMDAAKTIPNPNHVGDRDLNSLRVGLLWEPTDALQIKLKVDLNNLDYHGNAFSVIPNFPLARGANLSDDLFTVGNNITDNYYVDKINRAALEGNYTFSNGIRLRSITGVQYIDSFLRNDDDGSVIPAADAVDWEINIQGVFRMVSQEVALISPDTGRFGWIAGAYYQRENLKFPKVNEANPNNGFFIYETSDRHVGAPGSVFLTWDTTRITKAVFGQASYKLTDDLQLQLGLRYTDYHVGEVADLGLPDSIGVLITSEADKRLTGKAALNWQVNPDHFLYAFVATGHTTGGTDVVNWPAFGLPDFLLTFGPQETTDYEVGWKGKFLQSTLHTQVGLFYTRIEHYQANFAVPANFNLSRFQNLETPTDVYGVELTAQGRFGHFSFDVGAALLHSSAGQGSTTNAIPGSVGFGDPVPLAGHKLPYTPEATFNVGAQYEFELGDGATLTPRADYGWTGEQRTSLIDAVDEASGVHFQRVPAHHNVNAQLVYQRGNLKITGYVTNVTDTHYIQNSGGGGDNAYANEPRQVGIRVNKGF
jgi:iron complex outermembrane receptor protein